MSTKINAPDFIPLSRINVDELSDLSVKDEEKNLICSNPEWIAQAAFIVESITFGIFLDKKPIGLISLIDPRLIEEEEDDDEDQYQPDCIYIWRVMVDKQHRGGGYGTSAIRFAQQYAKIVGLSGVSLTTMDKENGNALPFYQKLGFLPTGRRLNDEIELVDRRGSDRTLGNHDRN